MLILLDTEDFIAHPILRGFLFVFFFLPVPNNVLQVGAVNVFQHVQPFVKGNVLATVSELYSKAQLLSFNLNCLNKTCSDRMFL